MSNVIPIGPDADPRRTLARRLGAPVEVVPDPMKPRLITCEQLHKSRTWVMSVVIPRRRPWWAFWRPCWTDQALFVMGFGTYWERARWTGSQVVSAAYDERDVNGEERAMLANLWVNRNALVEEGKNG